MSIGPESNADFLRVIERAGLLSGKVNSNLATLFRELGRLGVSAGEAGRASNIMMGELEDIQTEEDVPVKVKRIIRCIRVDVINT